MQTDINEQQQHIQTYDFASLQHHEQFDNICKAIATTIKTDGKQIALSFANGFVTNAAFLRLITICSTIISEDDFTSKIKIVGYDTDTKNRILTAIQAQNFKYGQSFE